jgi:prepilin-type N-terminal cleavage/methylation domain-containing protein
MNVQSNSGLLEPRHGLTLVELVVAIALSTLAMTALVGFLPSLRKLEATTEPSGTNAWRSAVVATIEQDLVGARLVGSEDGKLTMIGHLFDTDSQRHVPMEVAYATQWSKQNQWYWLIRKTVSISQSGEAKQEILCGQVLQWTVERIDNRGDVQPIPTRLGPAPEKLSFKMIFRAEDGTEFAEEWLTVAN